MRNCLTIGRKWILVPALTLVCWAVGAQSSVTMSSRMTPEAQSSVTGVITDDAGQPVAGATVSVQGTSRLAITGGDGVSSIGTSNGETLEFALLGYVSQSVPVGTQSVINVTLRTDAQMLEDVVVVGYGTMQKRQVTSSIQSVSGDDLPIGVCGASIAQQLQGKVAGLVMRGTDSPNADMDNDNARNPFQLRGMASINASRGPLVVIDGMPGGDMRSLIPEEIQSIDVLKDASAGAIYGTRATGGVILVTTKQAKTGRVSMTYTGEVSLKKAFGAPDLLRRDDYIEHVVGAGGKTDHGSDTDWWDEALTDNPTSHRHVLTLQGGVDDARILGMLSYGKNVGVLRGDSRKDFSGRLNASFKVLQGWVEIGTNMSYRQADRNRSTPSIETLMRANPTEAVYDPDSATGWNIWTYGGSSNAADTNTIGDAALKTRDRLDKWFRPDVSLKVNIKPVRGLSYRQTASYENFEREDHDFDPSTVLDSYNNGRKGRARLQFEKTELMNADGYFSYVNDFGKHSINATAGYSYYQRDREDFWAENFDFSNDKVKFWNLDEGSYLRDGRANMDSGKDITQRLMAYFARASYSYDDKYMATASIRHEGSSKFGANNRWGTFWAISAGWRISREGFMENVTWVDDLKIRAAYGVTGNEGFSADYAARMYGSDTRWMMPDGSWAYAYGVSRNINPDLGWEEKREWNIGLDFSVLDNRIYGSFDWYRRKIHGLIYEVDVPQPPNTEPRMHKNIGVMQNVGWELILGADIIRGKNWSWNTSLNLSHNTTKVNTLWGNQSEHTGWAPHQWIGHLYRLEEGTTVGSYHIFKHAGVNEEGGYLEVYNKEGEVINIKDAGDEDRIYQKNFMPKLILGWSHSVAWKNLSLDFTLTSWIDYDVCNVVEMFYGLNELSQGNNRTYDAINKNGKIKSQGAASDYFIYDGTFLKLQNLTLGYTIPLAKHTNDLVQSVKVYFTGTNLFRITNYPGLNPEVDITGWEGGSERPGSIYPQTRTFTFGAQLTF